MGPFPLVSSIFPWDSRKKKKKLSWDYTMYPWFTSLPCWKQHQNLPTQWRPHNQIQLSCGKCFRPVSSSGDRDRNTSWWGWPWPGAMLQMDLSDYFAKKHKYQSLRMTFLTYVGLIQGLPGLSKMVKLLYHPNLVFMTSSHRSPTNPVQKLPSAFPFHGSLQRSAGSLATGSVALALTTCWWWHHPTQLGCEGLNGKNSKTHCGENLKQLNLTNWKLYKLHQLNMNW